MLLADQFEELFDSARRSAEAQDLENAKTTVDLLLAASLHVCLTMRAEYVGVCSKNPELADAATRGLFLVPQLTRAQLREVIVEPLRSTGANITDALVDRLLNEASASEDPQFGGSPNCASTGSFFACGTVFKLDTFGNYTVLHFFTGGSDGSNPRSALIMDGAGNLYGTTGAGGASGNGTVFKLTLQTALAPTITSILPTSAIAGGAAFTLTVNGTNFVSGSTISFNGNRTTTFVSATQLTAAILASDIATGGTFSVTVTNPAPGGTSNAVSFTVVTPQQATQAIINAVNTLYSQKVLNGGQDNSLVKTLQQAINLMNAGKNAGAIQNLNLFISEVNDLVSSRVLSSAQAAPLISAAQALIARLSQS